MEGVDPEVRASFDTAIEGLKKEGAKIVEVSLPNARYALSTYYLIAPSEASSNLAVMMAFIMATAPVAQDWRRAIHEEPGEGFGAEVKLRIMLGTYALSAGYYDAYYLKANRSGILIQKDFEDAFSRCHCIAVPTSPWTAFRLGEKTDDPLTMYLSDIFTCR